MFQVTFPVDIGTKVKLPNGDIGAITCYQCVTTRTDEFCVMVSGIKESWCGEYLLGELEIITP